MPEQRKLTKRVVDALCADPAGRDVIHFDAEVRGFGVRIKPSGAKSYVLKYRTKHGLQRKLHIARVGDITPDQARDAALKLRGRIAGGQDPVKDRHSERNAQTVAQLCDEYLEAEKGRIKASTLAVDRSRIDRHVKPLLGSVPVASLTPADMEKFLRDVMAGKSVKPAPAPTSGKKVKRRRGGVATGGPAVASRTLGMLGTILERAVRDGVLVKNPMRGVKRPKDRAAKPAFSFEKVKALGAALRDEALENSQTESAESETGRRAIRALLLTGFRRMEDLTIKWEMIDAPAHCARFEETKTDDENPDSKMRALGRAALEHFASFKPKNAKPTDYVFPGSSKAGHLVGLPKMWGRIAKRANLKRVTLHGLRHWFASAATELGYSDIIIGALIGHAKKGITGRYATAPDPALVAAADRISVALALALDGKSADNVVRLPTAG